MRELFPFSRPAPFFASLSLPLLPHHLRTWNRLPNVCGPNWVFQSPPYHKTQNWKEKKGYQDSTWTVLYTCISFFHLLPNRTTNIQTWDACHVFLVVSLVPQPALQCPKQPTERSLHIRHTLSARQVTSDVENRIWRIPCHLEDMCIMLVSGHGLKNDFYYICSMLFSGTLFSF